MKISPLSRMHETGKEAVTYLKKAGVFSYKNYRSIRRIPYGEYYSTEGGYRIKKNAKLYRENVYLIQGGGTYSAAVDLSTVFQYYKMGEIIGEETGGLTSGYIDSPQFILPNTNIEFYCAIKEFINAVSNQDGRGMLPDIEYPTGGEKKDFSLKELKEMLQLIQEKK
jgi:C-terminal processing protease CtpA/Prc